MYVNCLGPQREVSFGAIENAHSSVEPSTVPQNISSSKPKSCAAQAAP